MFGINSVISHVGDCPPLVCGIISLVIYCISSKDRWRRFLVLLSIFVMHEIAPWLLPPPR